MSEAAASVIVLNWNGRGHLEHCLAALAAQTRKDFAVVVVDNASGDDSVAWLRAQTVLPVTVVALGENRGFSGGNASGLPHTRGEFIILLNNDTAPEPDWLERLLACAGADGRRGIVASLLTTWDGALVDTAGDGVKVTGRGFQRHKGAGTRPPPPSGPSFSACAGAACYRRALVDDVGFLEDRFFMNCEDTDLAFRARLRGWEVWYCAEARVRHRVSGSQGVNSPASVWHNTRNHLWLWVRCMPGRLMLKYSPWLAAELVFKLVFWARHGRFVPHLRGLGAGLAGLPWAWRTRRAIQARRTVELAALERGLVRPSLRGWWRAARAGREGGGGAA